MKKFGLVLAVILLSGCATIISGKKQQLSINSNVQGADITLNGMPIGKTPFIGEIAKPDGTKGATLTLSKEGYESKTIVIDGGIEPTFWVNILSGGAFGSTTDYSTKSMYKYSNSSINVDLVKSEGK